MPHFQDQRDTGLAPHQFNRLIELLEPISALASAMLEAKRAKETPRPEPQDEGDFTDDPEDDPAPKAPRRRA